ncbi:SseB protein N-terminal domain-containing protein [Streptomyces yunnanensis]|uniref:SseB protein N-terminal domain-containing protein n=1 Tax=Streptomyces yunnanensis TaxID=156453 RepID=A0A9X8MY51_9ACTN|nr:SseB protein N-terminal domain-containing protein [Streptomyces yunnanensis]SHN31774.1 SseB protein N-terminal domain-containing protein [Streptomyces yunnanensis]
MALEFPPPVTALDEALQRAVTGYGSEQELLAAFRDATLILFAQEGQAGLYTIVEDDGSRYIPAFTHPIHAPDTWHQWQQTTGHQLAATGLPIRLNPGHRISLTIPGEAGNQAGGENVGPHSSSPTSSFGLPEALVGAPLLAAGLLTALGRRRRTALWQSAMDAKGRRAPELRQPTGAVADTQDALLVGADPQAVRDLDHALRGLASALTVESRTLPPSTLPGSPTASSTSSSPIPQVSPQRPGSSVRTRRSGASNGPTSRRTKRTPALPPPTRVWSASAASTARVCC